MNPLAQRLLLTLLICLGIAVMLTVLDNGGFAQNVLYSACIGLSCHVAIDGARVALARLLAWRDPHGAAARTGWPGWAWMVPCIVIGVSAGLYVGFHLGDALTGHDALHQRTMRWRGYLFLLLLSLGASLGGTHFFHSRGRLAAIQAEAEVARRVAAESRLKLLEAQLEPHMLFNTLANLRALIAVDPPRAQAMLDHMIGYLRGTLQGSRHSMHSLGEEFARTADYLALMQVRMGERLTVELDLPAALAQRPVPTLLLQPLVENAIKHGLEPRRAGGLIRVQARAEGGRLVLSVNDTGAGMAPGPAAGAGVSADATGFGLEQVRARLSAVFGSEASLELAYAGTEGGGTRATLTLPGQGQG
jgi:signal transduction histidine kinase